MNEKITLKYILKLLFENKKSLILGQLITIIAIVISVPIPLLLPLLVDEVLLNKPDFFVNNINELLGNGSAFYYIAIVTFIVLFLRLIYFIFGVIITKIFTKISKYVTFKIREKLLNHLELVNMNEYESLGSGSIGANLVTDVNTLDNFIVSVASKFIASILTLIAVAIVIIKIDLILGLMILFIQPIIMIISKKIANKTGLLKKEENKAIEIFQNNINETLDLFGQIKASNKEKFFFQESVNKAKNIQITSNEFNYKSVAYERFSFTIFLFAFEIFRAVGLVLVAYSDLSIGLMFAMFGYIWFIMTPVQDILTMQYSYASAKAAINRINKILDLKVENNGEKELEKDIKEIDISIKNLSFSYNENKKTLQDISFEIKSGEKVAIIGASGSGKTTIAHIISGFYSKNSGDILYNNISIDKLNRQSLRENIFLVLQMPILFNNSLRFNITMGNDNISNEKIYEALKIAQLFETVENMPEKLDTIVGKHGIRLSGGQRQRLSIARMIIANPAVVIFDESTSALDVHTETKLFSDLEEFLKSKTVITIAHRLSTVKNADMIYVLEDGKLVQSGKHEELEEQEGHYLEFVKKQLI
ncbi:ABC transporter ATP-binding protein [Arcobacter aquimarinus]|uniref:ABC transporter, ATP-binding/permease components n=1 Tax=Arcobacter aquimarinus TaxID=1315211 RepID=A0AAE7E1U9_9BACT|nr:ABC transporter ATP-binding protein [Arcobacter aquimarinus]QKE26287.1 ABC transporter, ATP-binding/permease components [Arcobacter aquimarinus]RXI35715.1 ABC transporter ATP-binding protein [Arcobacter aquimarinus]